MRRNSFFIERPSAFRRWLPAGLILCFLIGLYALTHRKTAPQEEQVEAAQVSLHEVVPQTCVQRMQQQPLIGIQAGHYQMDKIPAELSKLKWDLGASAGGVDEVDITLDIAKKTVALLMDEGIPAEVLPATVPEDYCASAFVAVHADGNDDASVYGYKVAPSFWDTDGRATSLSDNIRQDYALQTGMRLNPTITDNMTQYYAFNFQRFVHALDQDTPGALIEVGFITNPGDRNLITRRSATAAQGITNGIKSFLAGKQASTLAPTTYP